ncbi:ATP synthase subunit I [Exiguobacterium sp. AM39-5BH]|uniref:ATP synthase subunit I n=1 Tax=Exiguobacterium sp. AM39-5BH TaxID=2292355 RepID=UPI000FE220D1|nr:ATP synthase subunit I [Exiguobacterium sp. AM39-5BH]RHB49340.1 ATP synthase subunit I [Exiguobacterium sp. AM39-5BH]
MKLEQTELQQVQADRKAQQQLMKRYTKWFIGWFAILLIGALIVPMYKPVFLGLFLGGVASLIILHMQNRSVIRMYDVIEHGRRPKSHGTVSRMAVGALAVIVGLFYEDRVSLIAVVTGLIAGHIIQFGEFTLAQLSRKRGEY